MKNIHVLPTNKEPVNGDLLLRHIWKDTSNECISWWRYDDTIIIDDVVQYTTLNGSFRDITSSFKAQNIYITSDEEIKEGDWCLDKFNQRWKLEDKKLIAFDSRAIKRFSTDNILGHECKKIILTTDQDLIKDGVQDIDDEFLEWFVKNPSCEFVKVAKEHDDTVPYPKMRYCKPYKIITPKKEPKQETLEEAGIIAVGLSEHLEAREQAFFIAGFQECFKWQQERRYSEEEVELIANEMVNWAIDNVGNPNPQSGRKFDEVIAKFKKK